MLHNTGRQLADLLNGGKSFLEEMQALPFLWFSLGASFLLLVGIFFPCSELYSHLS